jgi:hypothetical protein
VAVLRGQLGVGLAVDIVSLEQRRCKQFLKGVQALIAHILTDSFDPARNLDFWLSSVTFISQPGREAGCARGATIDDLMQRVDDDGSRRAHGCYRAQKALADPCRSSILPRLVTIAMSSRVRRPSVLQPPCCGTPTCSGSLPDASDRGPPPFVRRLLTAVLFVLFVSASRSCHASAGRRRELLPGGSTT